MPTAKELKAMASACRKAGILSFKGFGVEFTLAPETAKAPRRRKAAPEPGIQVQGPNGPTTVAALKKASGEDIDTDEPTAEELLFWSVGGDTEEASQ